MDQIATWQAGMRSVDVVVPCYQYGGFLRDSVGSVLAQQGVDVRVLIIDNASTDNSVEVAQQIASEDSRVNIVARTVNLGTHASYNEAIDWASADYFMILDADDMLAPGCLRRAAGILDQEPSVVFCHGVEKRMLDGEKLVIDEAPLERGPPWKISTGSAFVRRLCAKGYNFIGNPTVVRRTSAQKVIGYYDPNLHYADDMNMWLRLAVLGNVAETDQVQGIRRVHPHQLTRAYLKNPVMDLDAHLKNFEDFFNRKSTPDHLRGERDRVTRRIAFNAVYMSAIMLRSMHFVQSAKCAEFAIRTYLGLQKWSPGLSGTKFLSE